MTWVKQYDRYEGSFHQVSSIDLTVKQALEQDLLEQIPDHVGDCSDDNLRPKGWGRRDSLIGSDDYVRCPRCMLLLAAQPEATGLMLNSPLKLRVVVQVKHDTLFNHIRWD